MMTQLKFIFRKLWRNRLFTMLNILGLSVCICVVWVIFKMVSFEYSYDKKIPGSENIYQIVSKSLDSDRNREVGFSGVSKPILNALQNDVTGVEKVVPMFYKSHHRVVINDGADTPIRQFENGDNDIQLVATNTDYFNMLDYQWLVGNALTALDAPDKVVLTDTRAQEYFPSLKLQEMIGEVIVYDDSISRRVSGVVAQLNFPNSFSAYNNEFIPINKEDIADKRWGSKSSDDLMFIQPVKGVAINNILDQLNEINLKYNKENYQKYNFKSWYDVIPLSQKHFEIQYTAQNRTANKKVLNGLMIVGAFLLLLACINYINLSTAELPKRAKEIGIRKTLGSSSRQLIFRFIAETFIVTLLAALFSLVLTVFAVKLFADFLPEGVFDYMNYGGMIGFMLTLIIVISLLSGLYPAWLSSMVQTVNVLKGVTEKAIGINDFSLRKGLIVFQFLIAQVFIIGSLIIHQQLRYATKMDLGFNKNGIVTVEIPYYVKDDPKYKGKQFVLKNELLQDAAIMGVSIGSRPMDNSMWGNIMTYYKDTTEVQQQINMKFGDVDYLKLYGFHLLAGRNFVASDTMNEIVINEKAVRAYGFQSPQEAIGELLSRAGDKAFSYPIVGVVSDFHQFGVQSEIDPVLIATSKNQISILNIKLSDDTSKWSTSIKVIEREWKKLYEDVPFKYRFYDETIGSMYKSEVRTQTLVNAATAIAILISCLGLFGLATLTAYQRTKEIGIRKVLGSNVSDVVVLLSKDYLKLIGLAILISIPVAWWAMHKWLENFAYRIEIKWWMFLATGIVTILIALSAVSFRAIKAAMANPVDSLKDE